MSSKHLENGSEFPPLKKGTLRLYSMRFCPYAERARIILAAKKIPYETVNINLVNKPDWFLARAPAGTVPVLEHDDGKILYESLVICEYLDELYPEPKLIPKDSYEKARQKITIEENSVITSAFYKILRAKDAKAAEELNEALEYVENKLSGDFFGGKNVSMADYMIWPWLERFPILSDFTEFRFDEKRFPKLANWIERMKELPAAKEAFVETEEMRKFFRSYSAGKPVYDFE